MGKPGVAFGLSFGKKAGAAKPPPVPRKTKAIFGDDDDDGDDSGSGRDLKPDSTSADGASRRQNARLGTQPPRLKSKAQPNSMFGDLSAARSSRKNAEMAQDIDPSVYEYDAVYDSMKPKKREEPAEVVRKPKYMRNLLQAAEVRKRDALIAEEKKIARERAAEGDEFADKEKFVTAAYKKQQEENRRIEEEEKRREAQEARVNKGRGMAAFYKQLLDKDEERHAAVVKAAEELAKNGPRKAETEEEEEEEDKEKAEAALARELNKKGIAVAINEDGQVVDKRQLLQGGLNVGAKKKEAAQREMAQPRERSSRRDPGGGGRLSNRQQESRNFEDQLEQLLKRSRGDDDSDDDDEDPDESRRQAKSRKVER